MRYLAIDLGDKRTGLALGDEITRLVSPLETVEVPMSIADGTALLHALAKAVEENIGVMRIVQGVKHPPKGGLVVGLPLNMDGTENPRTRHIRAFAARLGERTGLQVYFQDERLTTEEAHWQMKRTGMTRQQKKEKRDALAASNILRDFLEQRAREATSGDAASGAEAPPDQQ